METKLQKYVVMVGMSMIAISIFYYLVIFLPNTSKKEDENIGIQNLTREQARCSESANTYAREIEGKSIVGFTYSVDRYKYDPQRGSCFIEWNLFWKSGTTYHIENVYTKENISSLALDINRKAVYGTNATEEYLLIQRGIFGY